VCHGPGSRGVAIFPQSDGDLCQFADLAHHLADAGYRVATFGPWSSPYDRPVAATYAALTAAGAQRVVLLGASQGAALALATAPALDPPPAGVVSLSAESTAGTFDALAGVAAYPGPVLLIGTENDMYAPGGVTRRMAEQHAGDEQVLLFPGGDHGIQLLPRTQEQIEAFVDRVLST
jgi:pimeloyl-ACP methyl ester carboxylesterase